MVRETADLRVNVSLTYEARHMMRSTPDFKVGNISHTHAIIHTSDAVLTMFVKHCKDDGFTLWHDVWHRFVRYEHSQET